MTGEELAALRKAAGLSQTALAKRAGIGRHAVSYWECKPLLDSRGWALLKMFDALGLDACRIKPHHYAHAGGWGVRLIEAERAALDAQMALWHEREAIRAVRRRVICGATTRKGVACRNKSEPGKWRCKFHGGRSTGARTAEGKSRIAEAQRARWARWRAGKGKD